MSASFDIVVSPSTFLRDNSGQFLAAVDAGATAAVLEIAAAMAALAEVFAPFRTGALAGSIEGVQLAAHEAAAVARRPYAAPQEKGAGPHAIPNAFGRGRDYGTAPDFHPGNPAVHYLRRAAMAIAPAGVGILDKHLPGD